MMHLLRQGAFTLASGEQSWFKVDCDALNVLDWATAARLVVERVPPFGMVEGVPKGGNRLATLLSFYATRGPLLIVDDVWTTGGSMEAHRAGREAVGAVLFARGPVAEWVTAVFTMSPTKLAYRRLLDSTVS